MARLELTQVRKSFGPVEVVHGVDLVVNDAELTVLLGPSGCGKSTLLRMIAGIEEVTAGDIAIDGVRVNDLAPKRRACAMVFQNYALYPHKRVYDNIAFPLLMARIDKATIDAKVRAAAQLLQLEDYLDRLPRDLSGGQRQRVAMGRAIVRDPKAFLFDEPLSNLDAELRVQMRLEIAQLQRQLDATMIFVTHDQVEAMTLAHKLVIMRDGNIEQEGAPRDVYNRPANIFVARFVGTPAMNLFDVVAADNGGAGSRLTLAGGHAIEMPYRLPAPPSKIGIRPEHRTRERAASAAEGRRCRSNGSPSDRPPRTRPSDRACCRGGSSPRSPRSGDGSWCIRRCAPWLEAPSHDRVRNPGIGSPRASASRIARRHKQPRRETFVGS